MILYAPIIDPKIPAFVKDSDGMVNIDVNFMHNRAVPAQAVEDFQIAIWQYNDIAKNTQIPSPEAVSYDLNNGQVKFTLSGLGEDFLQAGMYYKIQIAYKDADGVGPYSTLGISRYAGEQNSLKYGVKSYDKILQESQTNEQNFNSVQYSGYYENRQVPSEIVYQYRFILTDNNNNIIQDTQWQIPHSNTETPMPFSLEQDLQSYTEYTLNFQIQTINGLTLSKNYTIIEALQPPTLYKGQIKAYQDGEAIDNGYVKISLNGINDTEGYYRLVRHCNNEIGNKWDEIALFSLPIEPDLSKYYWKDFTVEHGNTYTYALQQYSSDEPRAYSERIETEPITVSFEHMFLSDGKRQLRIAFNPKVSSFKETILEQKTDTIGSQFPFFSRNGHVCYKELSISGLISYWMDSDEYFGLTFQDLQSPATEINRGSVSLASARHTNLDDINFRTERQYKLAVLKWLNNGKPKLFRSPAEGNCIVRLMNISLSPIDTVGRMLHTFNATGYEMAEYNNKNLVRQELLFIQQNMRAEKINNSDFDALAKYGNYFSFTITADDGVFPCITDTYKIIKIYSLEPIGDSTITLVYDNKNGSTTTITSSRPINDITNLTNIISIQTSGSVLCHAFKYNFVIKLQRDDFIELQRGDFNGDKKITEKDLAILQSFINKGPYYDAYVLDIDGNGRADNQDLVLLQQYLDGWSINITPLAENEHIFYHSNWPCNGIETLSLPKGYTFYSYACFDSSNNQLHETQYKGVGSTPPNEITTVENTAYIRTTIGSTQYTVPPNYCFKGGRI